MGAFARLASAVCDEGRVPRPTGEVRWVNTARGRGAPSEQPVRPVPRRRVDARGALPVLGGVDCRRPGTPGRAGERGHGGGGDDNARCYRRRAPRHRVPPGRDRGLARNQERPARSARAGGPVRSGETVLRIEFARHLAARGYFSRSSSSGIDDRSDSALRL